MKRLASNFLTGLLVVALLSFGATAQGKKVTAALLPTLTTGAFVVLETVTQSPYKDANGNDDPDSITRFASFYFNGQTASGGLGTNIVYARNATEAQQQTAVRNKANELLAQFDPASGTLSNANIQIVGLSK